MSTKTDNHNPAGKLALRRHFLRTYHSAGPIHVLDCFQASAFLWRNLRKEFALDSYWGVDLKPKKGRLKLDSQRILDQPGWTQNVIDLDAYGSPWPHWLALLAHGRHDCTVFLTIGLVKMGGGGGLSRVIRELLGIHFAAKLPPSLGINLHDLGTIAALAHARRMGFEIIEAREATPGAHARYIGVRLTRK